MPAGDAHIDFTLIDSERKARGWSFDKLAHCAGLSVTTLFHAKSGRAVSYRTLTKLAQAINASPRDLTKRGSRT
ncbi:helix-turn-helix domain-containing protein [Megasphaera elsdenii]|uniref:helix-turn-helix domain-containing protein n=1 Tax=Megasphaera elsdenii TaxID=907 RepID=UPI0033966C72